MGISDWSADVCSSDLQSGVARLLRARISLVQRRRLAIHRIRFANFVRGLRDNSSLRSILQNTGWLLTGKGVGAVLSLFYLAIVTRTLGPAGFGLFSLILRAAQTIGIIISFATWQIIVRYGQEYVPSADHGKFGRLFFFCIALDLCGAFVGSLIAMAEIGRAHV